MLLLPCPLMHYFGHGGHRKSGATGNARPMWRISRPMCARSSARSVSAKALPGKSQTSAPARPRSPPVAPPSGC
ncbi:DUF2933 domain-containing protein [Dechloromonas sp.]|uniref:DUF2933 domain-containing protein n=1 Tax=Dechloromonas sp. TaxID=1917218 RepID=UPI00391DD8EB